MHDLSFKYFLCFCILVTLSTLNCKNDSQQVVNNETQNYENKPNKVDNTVPQKIKEDNYTPRTYTTTCTTCGVKCVAPFEVGYDTSCLPFLKFNRRCQIV